MNAKDAWLATLGQLQVQLNRSTYDTWLRRAELLGYEDGRFVVTVPNAYARDWIEQHLLAAMTQTLSRIFERAVEIQVIVWDPVEQNDGGGPLLDYAQQYRATQGEYLGSSLNPDFTFERFTVGESNRYAALLSQAVAEGEIGRYSPVFLHGTIGLGKTHLLQAIAQGLLRRGLAVLYLTAEDFTTELVAAIRGQTTLDFREKYRKADAVLIDDLQFVEGKESTQAELVSIWDELRNRKRLMIFASDRLPCDMVKISKDARSRFQAGPIATIDPPDLSLRKRILEEKSARRGMTLPPDVRDMLAEHLVSSVRDLESAIDQLHTCSGLTGESIGVAMAARVLGALGTAPGTSGMTLEAVLEAIATFYRLSVEDLASRKRTKRVALARQLAMYLARDTAGASLPHIGEALGGRDHSTVLHGCARIAELLEADAGFAREVASIRAALAGNRAPRAGSAQLAPVLKDQRSST